MMRLLNLKEWFVIFLVSIFLFWGLFFIGKGFTGMYFLGSDNNLFCLSDDDCDSPLVCCYFYKEDSGYCAPESDCTFINELSEKEKHKIADTLLISEEELRFTSEERDNVAVMVSSRIIIPKPKSDYTSILSGVLLFLVGLFGLFVLNRHAKKS